MTDTSVLFWLWAPRPFIERMGRISIETWRAATAGARRAWRARLAQGRETRKRARLARLGTGTKRASLGLCGVDHRPLALDLQEQVIFC